MDDVVEINNHLSMHTFLDNSGIMCHPNAMF